MGSNGQASHATSLLVNDLLAAFHGAADRHAADAKMHCNALHAVGTRSIRFGKCSITINIAQGVRVQRLGWRTALASGDLLQRSLGIDQLLHALDERFGAQVDLVLQLEPGTRGIHALMDELTVRGDRCASIVAERPQKPVGRQQCGCTRLSRRRLVAAPSPSAGRLHHPGTHRVKHDVARELKQVAVLLNQNGFVSPLKEMADTRMSD